MYPANYYALYPAFPRDSTVFVAMSFDPRFASRWEQVIKPAIQSVALNGTPLTAVRVDARVVGDSILTEILQGIGRAQLVLADITSVGVLEDRPIRNANVMYEVGIAHAVRLPEEVLLFRSDQDALPFDTASVRVNSYTPDAEPEVAKKTLSDAVLQSLRELDIRRHLAVRMAADALDYPCFEVLVECKQKSELGHPVRKTMGDILSAMSKELAIQRLLAIGVLRAKPHLPSDTDVEAFKAGEGSSLVRYEITRFGEAVFLEFGSRFDLGRMKQLVDANPTQRANGVRSS